MIIKTLKEKNVGQLKILSRYIITHLGLFKKQGIHNGRIFFSQKMLLTYAGIL